MNDRVIPLNDRKYATYFTWNEASFCSTRSLKAFEAYGAYSQTIDYHKTVKKILWKYTQTQCLLKTWNSTALEWPFSDTDARGDESSSDPSRTGDGGWGGAT